MRMYDYPRADTLRAKDKIRRRVRTTVRHINRNLRKDVFGERFWIEIIEQHIRPWSDNSGWEAYFRIMFHDRENPERDYDCWFDSRFIIYSGLFVGGRYMDDDLNNFIVNSDFWEKYREARRNDS